MESWVYVVIAVISLVMCSIVVLRVLQYRYSVNFYNADTIKKTMALKDNYIKQLEKECDELEADRNHYKAKYMRSKQLPRIEVDNVPTEPEGLGALVDQYLPDIASSLPKEISEVLLQNKGGIAKFVSEHPEIVKKFLAGGGKKAKSSPQENPYEDRAV